MAEVVPNVQRDYIPSESESDNDEDFMAEENSLTKAEIEHECELLHREAEMDVEQLRKLYSGQVEPEPEQTDKSETESCDEVTECSSSLLPKLINSNELDDYNEDDDKDYQPKLAGSSYKEPKIGDSYQVLDKNIPQFKVALDYGSEEYETALWAPNNDCDTVKFLTDHRRKRKIRPEVNEKIQNFCIADSEDALSQLLMCNYRPIVAHKRIQTKSKLQNSTRKGWTDDDIAQFELGLSLKGKHFDKIQCDHLQQKNIKEIVEYYYMWKKSKRFDVFSAKTRNLKRKYDGNTVNYMEKLLDEIENKRTRKKEDKINDNSEPSDTQPLKPSKAENSQKVEPSTDDNSASDSESSTKVMTLEIHDNRWKVGTEH